MNSKKIRQYVGIIVALLSYYLIHEGAHLVYVLSTGTFKTINLMGFVGVQIVADIDRMTSTQVGWFCLVAPLATLVTAIVLVLATKRICTFKSPLLRAVMYYVTLIMLCLDPVYLSVLYKFVGGGDMNGISLLVPELAARISFGILFLLNLLVFVYRVLPAYKRSFSS